MTDFNTVARLTKLLGEYNINILAAIDAIMSGKGLPEGYEFEIPGGAMSLCENDEDQGAGYVATVSYEDEDGNGPVVTMYQNGSDPLFIDGYLAFKTQNGALAKKLVDAGKATDVVSLGTIVQIPRVLTDLAGTQDVLVEYSDYDYDADDYMHIIHFNMEHGEDLALAA